MKILEPVFNARTWLEDGVLRFERVDQYETVADYLIDVDLLEGSIDYKFRPSEGWAYGRFEYSVEALDADGTEISGQFNDIVEWNKPPQAWQKGSRDVTLQDFSPATFMQDDAQSNVVDTLRKTIAKRYNDLVLSNGVASKMKLLMFNPDSNKLDMNVRRTNGQYNRELQFNQNATYPELYNGFYEIDDPRKVTYMEGGDFVFVPDNFCNFVSKVDKFGTRIGIKSKYGIGIPKTIELDLESGTVKIKNPTWRLHLA